MTKQLHILNGYATYHLFKETRIEGDVCVWDEILSEGPSVYEVASQDFWKIRSDFVSQTFGRGEEAYSNIIEQFEMIKSFSAYDELVLWYEFDLFCQVNLMALLSWLFRVKAWQKCNIHLICVGKQPGYGKLIGLGQLPVREFKDLLEGRIHLSEPNLSYANQIWSAYTSQDPRELAMATVPHPVFTYLAGAIKAHFKRFPDPTGFNEIENEILTFIAANQQRKLDELVRYMLQWQHYYGFGDLQYYRYIKTLEEFIAVGDDSVRLTRLGETALKEGIIRKNHPLLDMKMGGTSINQYYRKGLKLHPR
ncbi:MAG: hypothetical protein AAFO69_08705 [Bacteroidota bacterium]